MPGPSLIPLLPLGALAAAAIVSLLAIAIRRDHLAATLVALAGFACAFILALAVTSRIPARVSTLFVVDSYGLFFTAVLAATGFAVTLLAQGYLSRCARSEEFYVLLLLATLGGAALVVSSHFASFFLGLNILSVSLYGLIAYLRSRERSIEAGIKYLVLAAASTAFLLFGMALIYSMLGTMEFGRIAAALPRAGASVLLLSGLALLLIGIGFKLALVPFHMWTPDVYEGAAAPVTAFIATASKAAVMALLLRFGLLLGFTPGTRLWLFLALIAGASMVTGNLLALRQQNLKRLLAYSSIAHQGYILVAFLAGGVNAARAVTFYIVAYTVASLAAFGVIGILSSGASGERDRDAIAEYRGLPRRHPWLAAALAAALLSLAGIPLTAGFVGKLLIIQAGVSTALWTLVILLVGNSAVSIYYYLRVIVELYLRDAGQPANQISHAEDDQRQVRPALSVSGAFILTALVLALIWFGVYPGGLMNVIERSITALF